MAVVVSGGAAAAVAAMGLRRQAGDGMADQTMTRGRRAWWTLNEVVAVILAAALTGLINYLAARHYVRWDVTPTGDYTLSERTVGLLRGLQADIDVTVFFSAEHEAYGDVRALLEEYAYVARRAEGLTLRIEWIDPVRDLARAAELRETQGLTQGNVVIFSSAGRQKVVRERDLVEYDYTPLLAQQPKRRMAFRGEQAFTSAIRSVTVRGIPVVYFIGGHGEREISSYERYAGYSQLARVLRDDFIAVKPLLLAEAGDVPDDCAALVIAGPTRRYAAAELEMLRAFLSRKGRLLALLDPSTPTGLEELIAEWGVRLAADRVIGFSLTGRETFVPRFGEHAITRRLSNTAIVLYVPRSVEPIGQGAELADRPQVTVLATTAQNGWAERNPDQTPPKFDEGEDRKGPISVAVAVERGPVPGIDVEIRPTRMVVVGDSEFVANGYLVGGNEDFFLGALNWLLERDEMMAVRPGQRQRSCPVLTATQARHLLLVLAVGFPGVFAALGVVAWLRRRV